MQVLGPAADVVAVDSTAVVAAQSGRLVAVVGVEDLVVVDTPDAVLVVPRAAGAAGQGAGRAARGGRSLRPALSAQRLFVRSNVRNTARFTAHRWPASLCHG